MTRDRQHTEQKLIQATGQVLAKHGFAKLGVNSIAKQARLDKVLIYRYFDGLPGLMKAYAEQGDFWPLVDELLGEPLETFQQKKPSEQFTQVMKNHALGLQRRPVTLQILSWEMVGRNELTAHLEEIREQQGLLLTQHLIDIQAEAQHVDISALVAISVAAINYLAARSQHIQWFNGINIQQDEGWQRLTKTISDIAESLISDGSKQ